MLEIDFTKSRQDILNKLTSVNTDWELEIVDFINEWWNGNDSIVAETSGSTGAPKKIILEKEKVVNSALATGDFFDFKEGEIALLCMSPKFIAGKLMIVRAIVWKLNLICVEPNSNPFQDIQSNIHIDFVAMIPLQLQNSLRKLPHHTVSDVIVGGGAVDESLLQKIKSLETDIYSSYGMTETITHIALKKLNGKDSSDIFTAIDGVYLNTDVRGCLVISAKNISDTDVVTNDIVELISDKEFKWLGRFDNVINSGGIKIHPEKVEKILSKYISSPFFITSVKDDKFGEKVVLVVEGEGQEIDVDSLASFLPKYHSPKEVFYLKQFSRTDSGKIQRSKTLDQL